MKVLLVILGLALAGAAGAQQAAKKKAPSKKQQLAHKKPTPEQIRRFNELQKKQQ